MDQPAIDIGESLRWIGSLLGVHIPYEARENVEAHDFFLAGPSVSGSREGLESLAGRLVHYVSLGFQTGKNSQQLKQRAFPFKIRSGG